MITLYFPWDQVSINDKLEVKVVFSKYDELDGDLYY